MLPLIVALVAVGFAVWGRYQQTRTSRGVQQFVQQVCSDIAAGRDLSHALNPDDPSAEQRTIEQLRFLCADPATAARLDVHPVDLKSAPTGVVAADARAVMLRLDGVDRLGLIVQHDGDPKAIRITGYWNPAAASTP